MDNIYLRRFPYDSIRGAAERFADVYSGYLESPWQFFAMAYLTCLGNLIGDKVTIESQIHPQPRLYTAIVGESADDRKSEAIRQAVGFYRETLTGTKFSFPTCEGAGSAEGLATMFKNTRNLILIYDELKSFISKAQIEGSTLLECVSSLLDGNVYQSAVKKRSVAVKNAHLSILGACTLETYRKMWKPVFVDLGFINRLFVITGTGERKNALPKLIPPSVREPLKEDLLDILSCVESFPMQDEKYLMPIDKYALAWFEDWYTNLETSRFTKRLDTYGHRLLILFAINEMSERITSDIAQRVIKLLNWQMEIRKIVEPDDFDTRSARIQGTITRALIEKPLTKRDLERRCNPSRFGTDWWKMAITGLISARKIFWDEKTKTYGLFKEEEEVT